MSPPQCSEEWNSTSPPKSVTSSRTNLKKKRKVLLPIILVFALGIAVTYVHCLRSARFMATDYNTAILIIPTILNDSTVHQFNDTIQTHTVNNDVRHENASAANNNNTYFTNANRFKNRNKLKNRIQEKKKKRRRRNNANNNSLNVSNNSLNVSNMTAAQQEKLAMALRRRSPIIASGLPKTGTTSLHKYFMSVKQKGVFKSSHTYTLLQNGTRPRAGACMQENYVLGKPMLKNCGKFQVWSDSGYAQGGDCFYPLWHALDAFVESYPRATILLNTRNATEWTLSIQNWARGGLARRWMKCQNTPELPKSLEKEEWIRFYHTYHARIRHVCRQHATLTCLEFDIGNPKAGLMLEQEFGIPASHWRNCNPKDWTCTKTS